MNKTGPVQLREKPLKNGGKSLYLDIYQDGRRKYEFLHLYLLPGDDQYTRDRNKVALETAKTIQAKRIVELEGDGILTDRKLKMTTYCGKIIEQKRRLNAEYARTLEIALEKWVAFAGEGLPISKVTPAMLREFAIWLKENSINGHDRRGVRKGGRTDVVNIVLDMHQNGASERAIIRETHLSAKSIKRIIQEGYVPPRELSPSSVRAYFDKIGTFLERAVRDGAIPRNPMDMLMPEDRPKMKETVREFLTIEELKRLVDTPMEKDMERRLFLFCCFTGLRFSDATAVTWADIDSGSVHMVMKKTQRVVSVPISANAKSWLPERGSAKPEDIVFTPIVSLSHINTHLQIWARNAGVLKHISFHTSRHTFATILLTYGADLYTVSKLLGHTNISTTQIYAKIIDKKKEEAVNLIPLLK